MDNLLEVKPTKINIRLFYWAVLKPTQRKELVYNMRDEILRYRKTRTDAENLKIDCE